MKRLVIAIVLITAALIIGANLKAAEIQWSECTMVRPTFQTGFGYVLNDLERHVITTNHPMRNKRDPGNWTHELIHQLNNDLRQQTREHDNCFYVLKGRYLRLIEPDLTLKQVASIVPKEFRKSAFKTYLLYSTKWWNDEPLYVLDEATAFAASLRYHVSTQTTDKYRLRIAAEFVEYSNALVAAVERYDPDYPQLEQLKLFVEWNNRRITALINELSLETKKDYLMECP